MPILCREHNLLFIMTPRTACSAVGKVLREELGGGFFPPEDLLDEQGNVLVDKKHATLQTLIDNKLLGEQELKSLFVFTTVRNPFDSLVSLYVKKRTKYQPLLSDPNSWIYRRPSYVEDMKFCQTHSFDEWIAKNYKPGLLKRILGRGTRSMYKQYTKSADMVMRFESIQRDFKTLLKHIGITQDLSIPAFNTTSARESDYRKYYSKRSKNIVEYVFHEDLERYGYDF